MIDRQPTIAPAIPKNFLSNSPSTFSIVIFCDSSTFLESFSVSPEMVSFKRRTSFDTTSNLP